MRYHYLMSDHSPHPMQQHLFQLRSTASYACGYLPGQEARSQVVVPIQKVDSCNYDALLEQGFRRSGVTTYRTACHDCQDCVPMRIPVQAFRPDRSQRRALRQHGALTTRLLPLDYTDEHYALYCRYQRVRHNGGGMDDNTPEDYNNFLLESPLESMLVEFRLDGVLKIVSIIDVTPHALSAVYTFYADDAGASYGTYAILWQIELARRTRRRYVYLGYWIEQSDKMRYKIRYRPFELRIDERWMRYENCKTPLFQSRA